MYLAKVKPLTKITSDRGAFHEKTEIGKFDGQWAITLGYLPCTWCYMSNTYPHLVRKIPHHNDIHINMCVPTHSFSMLEILTRFFQDFGVFSMIKMNLIFECKEVRPEVDIILKKNSCRNNKVIIENELLLSV